MSWARKSARYLGWKKCLLLSFVSSAIILVIVNLDISNESGVTLTILNPKSFSLVQKYRKMGENDTEPFIDEMLTFDMLRNDVTDCLTKNVRQNTNQEDKGTQASDDNGLSAGKKITQFDSTIFTVLVSFNNLLSVLGIKSVIIEPSILYCMLLPRYQDLLLKRHFNIYNYSKPQNIVTYGVMDHDAIILQKDENIAKFYQMDFQPHFVQAPLADWMRSPESIWSKFETLPSHIFYAHKNYTIHVVVFRKRNGFYWHGNLTKEMSERIPPKEDLLFAEHDGAFEKFIPVSLENKMLPVAEFYIPSNPHYFLFEIQTSKFLECNNSRMSNAIASSIPKTHPGMSIERFNKRTLIALREFKAIFHPLLMNLWLWSGTMLGWYRQCDIIPYTTDVDFAAWASEVDDAELIKKSLLNNKHLHVIARMGVISEGLEFQLTCYSLRVDIFFVYPAKNGTWYAGHVPNQGFYFRYFFPNFTLCSAELLGQKVQVPCETEKVVASEYGPDWSKPVSSWSYETSSKGRGPNIYWPKDMRNKIYQPY